MSENWQKKGITKKEEKKYGNWYYEVTSTTPWNYALPYKNFQPENIKKTFLVEKKDRIADFPWNIENAPITIKTKALQVPRWEIYNGSVGPICYFSQQDGT